MATVIYRKRTADTGKRLQKMLDEIQAPEGEVNWTGSPLDGAGLNAFSRTNKLHQLEELQAAGILVPAFCPAGRSFPNVPPYPGWLPRTNTHREGKDFEVGNITAPDFYVEPLLISKEKRLHVFKRPKGTICVIRTATKVPVEGKEAHPWVRSHANGWRFSYAGGSDARERQIAIQAVDTLGLDFAAVDIGTFCSTPLVIEVNTCPGLEWGNTLRMYADEIARRFSQ